MALYLETERLILRELLLTDISGMFELDSNPIVHKYLGNKPVKTIDESKKMIDGIIKQYKERGIGRLAAVEKATGNFIGWSGLKLNTEETLNDHINFIDIGYRFMPQYWGKGYATESSNAAIKYGFDIKKFKTIYGITMLENEASHQVLLKIGLNYKEEFFYQKENINLRWYELKNEDYEKTMS